MSDDDDRRDYARREDRSRGGVRYGNGGYGREEYGRYGAQGGYYGGYGGSFEGRDYARGEGYGRDYGGRGWDDDRSNTGRDGRRDWADRAGDEVASWFGDDDAERRRRQNEMRERRGYGWGGQRSCNRYRDDW